MIIQVNTMLQSLIRNHLAFNYQQFCTLIVKKKIKKNEEVFDVDDKGTMLCSCSSFASIFLPLALLLALLIRD